MSFYVAQGTSLLPTRFDAWHSLRGFVSSPDITFDFSRSVLPSSGASNVDSYGVFVLSSFNIYSYLSVLQARGCLCGGRECVFFSLV